MSKAILVSAAAAAIIFALPKAASACTPYGAIGTTWTEFEGDLGPCTGDEANNGLTISGTMGRIQPFEYGWVNWQGGPYAYEVHGAIGAAWHGRYGGIAGMGYPITNEYTANTTYNPVIPQTNTFSDASGNQSELYWGSSCSNSDYVCGVWGQILLTWREWGGHGDWYPNSESYEGIGFPEDDAHDNGATTYVEQDFQGGYIFWHKSDGHSCVYWDDDLYYNQGGCPSFPPF
jgi:hypothetical protein